MHFKINLTCCDRVPWKHGRDRQNYQRWRCPVCKKTWSDNPDPGEAGRKAIGDRPMTAAERKRRSRNKTLLKAEIMHKTFPWREQWNCPEAGFSVEIRHSGRGRIDGFDCQCYDEYQDIPGRNRYLIASVNAPYCNISVNENVQDGKTAIASQDSQ